MTTGAQLTKGAQPSGQELDGALARAIRQLIASAIEADEAGGGAGEPRDVVQPR